MHYCIAMPNFSTSTKWNDNRSWTTQILINRQSRWHKDITSPFPLKSSALHVHAEHTRKHSSYRWAHWRCWLPPIIPISRSQPITARISSPGKRRHHSRYHPLYRWGICYTPITPTVYIPKLSFPDATGFSSTYSPTFGAQRGEIITMYCAKKSGCKEKKKKWWWISVWDRAEKFGCACVTCGLGTTAKV